MKETEKKTGITMCKKKKKRRSATLCTPLRSVPVPHFSQGQIDEEDAAELCSGKDGFCIWQY